MRHHSVDISLLARMGAFCLALTSVPAAGRDYFVDQRNPAANDANPGTQAKPLRTIQAALDKTRPGDNVEVRAGVYHEEVKFKGKCGTAVGAQSKWTDGTAKYITVEAFGDERAT